MILIGDPHIAYETLSRVDHIDQIRSTKPNSTIIFKYDIELMKYCVQNDLQYAVIVTNITQSVYANALKTKYIISVQDLAKDLQAIAESYMFDSKILAIINSDKEIESAALNNIDGVIYRNIL